MEELQPHHTHGLVGLAAVAALFSIVGAGSPYLLAQTSSTLPSDTALTAPAPVDQMPVNTTPPLTSLIPPPPPCPPTSGYPGGQFTPPPGGFPQQPGAFQQPTGGFPPPPGTTVPSSTPTSPVTIQALPGEPTGTLPPPPGPSGTESFPAGTTEQFPRPPTSSPCPPPFGGQQPPFGVPQQQFPGQLPGEGQPMPGEFQVIDPGEVRNVLREITRMTRELDRFIKKTKDNPELLAKIQAVRAQLQEHAAAVKQAQRQNDPEAIRDAMESFWEAELWEEVNRFRMLVELPRELKLIDRELKRAEKLIAQKSFQTLGFEPTALKDNLQRLRDAYQAVQAAHSAGDLEATMEALETFHDGGHPGEIVSVMMRLKDLKRFTKGIRDKEVQEYIQEITQPILDAFNQGEFRDARELMDDAFDELVRLSNVALRLQRKRTGNREDMVDKFQALEEKLRLKIEKFLDEEEQQQESPAPQPSALAPAPAPSPVTVEPTG